jgi:hypothetical protein
VQGFPVHLPTFVARMLAFKLTIDTSKLHVQSLEHILLCCLSAAGASIVSQGFRCAPANICGAQAGYQIDYSHQQASSCLCTQTYNHL